MLYWIWFIIFLLTAGYFIRIAYKTNDDEMRDLMNINLVIIQMTSIFLTWDIHIGMLRSFLHENLPNQGDFIHSFTVFIITAISILTWASLPFIILNNSLHKNPLKLALMKSGKWRSNNGKTPSFKRVIICRFNDAIEYDIDPSTVNWDLKDNNPIKKYKKISSEAITLLNQASM